MCAAVCVAVRVALCAVGCVVTCRQMPMCRGFRCVVSCVVSCAVGCAVGCVASASASGRVRCGRLAGMRRRSVAHGRRTRQLLAGWCGCVRRRRRGGAVAGDCRPFAGAGSRLGALRQPLCACASGVVPSSSCAQPFRARVCRLRPCWRLSSLAAFWCSVLFCVPSPFGRPSSFGLPARRKRRRTRQQGRSRQPLCAYSSGRPQPPSRPQPRRARVCIRTSQQQSRDSRKSPAAVKPRFCVKKKINLIPQKRPNGRSYSFFS